MHPADVVIIVVYLLAMPALGVLFGRRQRSANDYFIGERSLPWWAVCFSIVATETSTLTVISTPGLIWAGTDGYNGLTYLQLPFGYIIGRTLVSFILLPRYFTGNQSTAYAFLGQRFGSMMQGTSSVAFMITRVLAEGVRLFAGAIPIQLILRGYGLNPSYWQIIVVLTALTVIYALIGGIKAVVWVDVIQLSIYLTGAVVTVIVLLGMLPGNWASQASDAGLFRVFDFNSTPLHLLTGQYAFITAVFGGAVFTMASHGADQLIVQRLLSCRSVQDGRKALIGSGVVVTIQFALFLLIGLLLWSFNQRKTLGELGLKTGDDVFTSFIRDHLPIGVAGLMIAAILASTMGALASALNALSNSTTVDLYQRFSKRKLSDSAQLRQGRVWTLIWAVVFAVFASLFTSRDNPVIEQGLAITGYTYGALLGAFLLGLVVKKARQLDAVVAFVVTVVVMAVVILNVGFDVGGKKPAPLAFPWFTLLGVIITLVVGGLMSLRHRTPAPEAEEPEPAPVG
ncbi:MAG: sodium:solute symporter [Sciscionella sp.]